MTSPEVAKSGNSPGDESPSGDEGGAGPGRAVEHAGANSGNTGAGGLEGDPGGLATLPELAMGLGAGTWLWWALRVVAVQQRLLRNRSASLKAAACSLIPQVRRLSLA